MIQLIQGDALKIPLADGSVQCVVTSPPYYGLRDYGTSTWEGGDLDCKHVEKEIRTRIALAEWSAKNARGGGNAIPEKLQYKGKCGKCGAVRVDKQMGLEPTLEEYIAKMVQVFREVKRVLRDDGTCWLNMGDSYAGGGKDPNSNGKQGTNRGTLAFEPGSFKGYVPDGLKPKDLMGIPWRMALALQADGWYLRSDIIWHKPNPMPESVRDRPTKSHEYVFLLSKSQHYYYDNLAIAEVANYDGRKDTRMKGSDKYQNGFVPGQNPQTVQAKGHERWPIKVNGAEPGRNKRTVWTIPTAPYSGAHFAVFPSSLVEPCILAGTSERGCCPTCGKPWERVVEKGFSAHTGKTETEYPTGTTANRLALLRQASRENGEEYCNNKITLGWLPSCSCVVIDPMTNCSAVLDPIPCTVLDPFAGTFTVGMVAAKHRRSAIGIELNPKYIELAKKRCNEIQVVML